MHLDLLGLVGRAAVVCAILVGAVASASAQPTDQIPQPSAYDTQSVRFTPFFALGDDLAPGGGAAFTFGWTRWLGVELEASLGTDAGRSSASLLYSLPRWGRWTVYAAGGAGFQRDEHEFFTDAGYFSGRKKNEFAVNIGAGATVHVTDKWAYRADFRWYNPKAEWPESWRVFNGITLALRR